MDNLQPINFALGILFWVVVLTGWHLFAKWLYRVPK